MTLAALAGVALLHRSESGSGLLSAPGRADCFLLAAMLECVLLLLALTGRPLPAIGLTVLALFILMLLNRAKTAVLGEPLLFSDIYMVRQMLFFPAFYFPYIPMRPFILLLLAAAGIVGAFVASGYSPPAVAAHTRIAAGLAAGAIMLLALLDAGGPGAAERWRRRFATTPPAFSPLEDGKRFGLVGAALLHAVWHHLFRSTVMADAAPRQDGLAGACVWPASLRGPLEIPLPHVVLIQAESFFHLKRLFPDLGADWTANFDRLAAQGRQGLLQVNCYGAYTIRTEFAVLTGISSRNLKTYAFNPYALAAVADTGALPRWFAGQGYATLCLHPGSGAFIDRHKAMPNMGFARFSDIRDFGGAPTFGPYTGDMALAGRIAGELKGSRVPQFIFAITIEAHGPWMPGRLAGLPHPANASPLPAWTCPDAAAFDGGTAAYARHLRNTDRMLGSLASLASELNRPLVIGLYGDHLGSLPRGVSLGTSQTATDFLVWHSGGRPMPSPGGQSSDAPLVPGEFLGGILLAAAHSRRG